MNVASYELCKELYELSGWGDTYFAWDVSDRPDVPFENVVRSEDVIFIPYPAYDLGYLLRKLPIDDQDEEFNYWLSVSPMDGRGAWSASYDCEDLNRHFQWSDSPESATAKLAIELFKQGILTKEQS